MELSASKGGPVLQRLTGTPEHPFFVEGGGLRAMGELGIGTSIVTRAGPPLVVTSLKRERRPNGVQVYNLEVEADHTYFVGRARGGTWVHNQCGPEAAAFLDDLAENGISGYSKHGLNQAISRNGRGVHPSAILDTVRNPQRAIYQAERDTFRLEGPRSIVVLNRTRQIVTVTARGHGNTRIPGAP